MGDVTRKEQTRRVEKITNTEHQENIAAWSPDAECMLLLVLPADSILAWYLDYALTHLVIMSCLCQIILMKLLGICAALEKK